MNSINVLKGNLFGRDVSIGTYIENGDKALFDINTIIYSDLLTIHKNLKEVLEGNFKYDYEWSGMRYCFESNVQLTSIEDLIFASDKIEVNTDLVFNLIDYRIKYLGILNMNLIMYKIKSGFESIKAKPSNFKIDDFRYKIKLSEENIFFVLLEEDFELTTDEFISTLKINKSLLKPDDEDCLE